MTLAEMSNVDSPTRGLDAVFVVLLVMAAVANRLIHRGS